MKGFLLSFLVLAASESQDVGMLPMRDVAIAGVAIGDSPQQVRSKLGEPQTIEKSEDYLSLHYIYPNVRVSFNDDVAAGLFTDSKDGCTPTGLCPGDSVDKMQELYGKPLLTNRETGRFYEYYGVDLHCWFQIPAGESRVLSISVACQP